MTGVKSRRTCSECASCLDLQQFVCFLPDLFDFEELSFFFLDHTLIILDRQEFSDR